jgi:Transposase
MEVNGMSDHVRWFIGIDWASEQHRVCLLDAEGKCVAERDVMHSGAELSEMCTWLLEKTAAEPAEIAIAIETPRGPVVEALLERGFKVFAVNPKQLDRFRDRFSVAGAKDDSRDAQVLAGSLRTDRQASRRLSVDDPLVIELREWSRIYDELKQEQNRLTNRMRGQLWRYYPHASELSEDLAAEWFLDPWQQVPTLAKAAQTSEKAIARVLKTYRIRRLECGRSAAHPAPAGARGGARNNRGRDCPYPHHRGASAAHQSADQEAERRLDELLRRDRGRGGERAGADGRAARRRDPAFLSRARKDQHRHAARRGLGASAAARLPRVEDLVGRGPGDPPQRQDLYRGATPCLRQPAAEGRLSLDSRGRAA